MIQLTYLSYFLLSSVIVVYVGDVCYRNGKIYILNYFPNKIEYGTGINKLLRIAYYLLNIGLAIWSLHSMDNIYSIKEMILEISSRLSYVLLIIASLHFIKIYTLYFIHKHFKN